MKLHHLSCATGFSVNRRPSISQGRVGKITSFLGDVKKSSAQLAVLQISVKFAALTFAVFPMLRITLLSHFGSRNYSGRRVPRVGFL